MTSESTKKVIIVGSQHLQNTLLAKYIALSSPFSSESTSSLASFFTASQASPCLSDLLFLIDSQNTDLDEALKIIEEHRNSDKHFHAVVFNLPEHANLEQIAAWPVLNGAFLEKTHEEEIIRGITAIFEGEIWLPRKLIAKYVRQARTVEKSSLSNCEELTSREVEVLKIMGTGAKNTDIASTLNLSPHTVKTHVYNIFKKINASNRLQAVNWAKEHL